MARIIDFVTGEDVMPKFNPAPFYAMLSKLPQAPTKEELVRYWTNDKTESLSEMWEFYAEQYNAMIAWMSSEVNGTDWRPYTYKKGYQRRNADLPPEVRAKRSDLIKACAEYGIHDRGDGLFWNEINRFLQSPRIAGKPIYDLIDTDELQAVIKRVKTICYTIKKI